jgi:hypothetical protein
MAKARGKLERWEVAIVKAMLKRGNYNDQDILAYFTRPTRSVNHRVIGEIRTGKKHKVLNPASDQELDTFLATWPEIDAQTGLSLRGDELLIKAREAMVAAVHVFNGIGLHFRGELFIVTAIIAWTYLLHAFFKRQNIDYRYYKNVNGVRTIEATKNGAEKYWDLDKCLRDNRCPLSEGIKRNLRFLLELRHEVEHRSTSRIDEAVSAKLQACCLNFNETIKTQFGAQFGLERRLPIALQLVTFGSDQKAVLKQATDLPGNIETMMNSFHEQLNPDQQADPEFAYRVAFIPKIASRASSADVAVEFIKADSPEALEVSRVLLKEVEKPKYRAGQIVRMMKQEGYPRFNMHHHTELWRSLDAKNAEKGYGHRIAGNDWYWYEAWLKRVREHCQENAASYQ